MPEITASILQNMICWLEDCGIEIVRDATAASITRTVNRLYEGGIEQFVKDGQYS